MESDAKLFFEDKWEKEGLLNNENFNHALNQLSKISSEWFTK